MANDCESKFRHYVKKTYPTAYCRKIPDFKQTGLSGGRGLPDYLVVCDGVTDWYEVKKVLSASRFPFSALSEGQWVEFRHMITGGASVWIAAYMAGELKIFSFKRLLQRHELFKDHEVAQWRTSAPIEQLMS